MAAPVEVPNQRKKMDIQKKKTAVMIIIEPPHDKNNEMACAPSEDSDQPGHTPSLTKVFAVRMKKAWVLCYPMSAERRLWSDCADAQADLSLRWTHRSFCWLCHEAAHIFSTMWFFHKAMGPNDADRIPWLYWKETSDRVYIVYPDLSVRILKDVCFIPGFIGFLLVL